MTPADIAEALLNPLAAGARSAQLFSLSEEVLDQKAVMNELIAQTKAVHGGDLSRLETMLTVQAHSLDAVFNAMLRKANQNLGEYLPAAETYLRLALEAQAQSRATAESLAILKNPAPFTFVRQTNIGNAVQINAGGAQHRPEPASGESAVVPFEAARQG
ncbi:hypothetical protein [Solimonas soli]|uniref:hypothetical protein n=1 Tax=Solimonas soli TaxID=413479 RepID=UPI0012F712A5|nr:hypothetical protein [Solimonas soli]